jgi:hypothetical protein
MADTPKTIRVTDDALADQIADAGKRLIELSMRVRDGFDVPVEFVPSPVDGGTKP